MSTGGYKPGGGRPKGSKDAVKRTRRWKVKPKPEVVTPPELGDADPIDSTPLDYMLSVMNDPNADAARRDRMAIAAAPFMHPRKEPVGQGKREAAQAKAEAAAAAGGKFAPRAAPRLAAIGGSRVDD